jgi:hypothetical protein
MAENRKAGVGAVVCGREGGRNDSRRLIQSRDIHIEGFRAKDEKASHTLARKGVLSESSTH